MNMEKSASASAASRERFMENLLKMLLHFLTNARKFPRSDEQVWFIKNETLNSNYPSNWAGM